MCWNFQMIWKVLFFLYFDIIVPQQEEIVLSLFWACAFFFFRLLQASRFSYYINTFIIHFLSFSIFLSLFVGPTLAIFISKAIFLFLWFIFFLFWEILHIFCSSFVCMFSFHTCSHTYTYEHTIYTTHKHKEKKITHIRMIKI